MTSAASSRDDNQRHDIRDGKTKRRLIDCTSFGESTIGSLLDPLEEFATFHAVHDDQQAFDTAVHVLVDSDNVDDMLVVAGPPVQFDLPPRFGVVSQHLFSNGNQKSRDNC